MKKTALKLHKLSLNKFKKFFKKKRLEIVLYTFVITFLVFISFVYFNHLASNKFTDEFNSFSRAYFMLKGKTLYSNIFSHHQPLMPYLSYFIQKLLNPDSLYELIAYHRVFIIFIAFISNIILLVRFRKFSILFILLFELSKYYFFGNLFLGEVIVAYCFGYLVLLSFFKFRKYKIYKWDYIYAGILFLLIAFTREPYLPAAILVLLYIFYGKDFLKFKVISILVISFFSILILFTLPLKDYIYSIFSINFNSYIGEEFNRRNTEGLGLLKIFIYPLLVFVIGKISIARLFLVTFSAAFLIQALILRKYFYKIVIFYLIVLGFLSVRFVIPGDTFNLAFHLLPWIATITAIISFFMVELFSQNKKLASVMCLALVSVMGISIFNYNSFVLNSFSLNKLQEFHNNYGNQYIVGEAIRILSNSDDKLFVDYWETLVYWQSGLNSPYEYSMFWPVMQTSERYTLKRREMFEINSPDFYYYSCAKNERNSPLLLLKDIDKYLQIKTLEGKGSCIYVSKEKFKEIDDEKWNTIKQLGYQKINH